MVNNLEHIASILDFKSEDDFYFLQIIKRRKENESMSKNSMCINTYYITSADSLRHLFPEIKLLCDFYNARACINLNKRSFKTIAFKTLQKITDQIYNAITQKDKTKASYKHTSKAFNSICGSHSAEGNNKKWILDFDTKDKSIIEPLREALMKVEPLKNKKKEEIGDKIVTVIDTKHGYHVITTVFNVNEFDSFFSGWATIEKPEIKKDNPTILYIPDDKE